MDINTLKKNTIIYLRLLPIMGSITSVLTVVFMIIRNISPSFFDVLYCLIPLIGFGSIYGIILIFRPEIVFSKNMKKIVMLSHLLVFISIVIWILIS